MSVNINMDASVAIALASREGLGRAKHIDIQELWIQDAVRSKKMMLTKVRSKYNVGDIFTKGLTREKIDLYMSEMGYEYAS